LEAMNQRHRFALEHPLPTDRICDASPYSRGELPWTEIITVELRPEESVWHASLAYHIAAGIPTPSSLPRAMRKAARRRLLALLKGVGQSGQDEIEERVAAWHLWRPLTDEEVRQTKHLAQ
jgi:hypothetical protein